MSPLTLQAKTDALTTARQQLITERQAVARLEADGQTPQDFDLRFALSEITRLETLIARLEYVLNETKENV